MARSDDKLERTQPATNGLESYRRLIELQKQMIELSQHHERSRRECEALRNVVTREAEAQSRRRRSSGARFMASAARLFRRFPLSLTKQFFS